MPWIFLAMPWITPAKCSNCISAQNVCAGHQPVIPAIVSHYSVYLSEAWTLFQIDLSAPDQQPTDSTTICC